MDDQDVKYQVLREYGDQRGVVQDIVVPDEEYTREKIERIGRQLAKQFKDKLIVAVNILRSDEIISDVSNKVMNKGESSRIIDYSYARYVRSRYIGLHQVTIYPRQRELGPVVIRYS